MAAFGGNAYTMAAAAFLARAAIAAVAAAASPGLGVGAWRAVGRARVVMLTAGQVHDVPTGDAAVAAQELGAPLHVLLAGHPDESDRRLVVAQASSFGLVGKELPLSIRVEDLPAPPKDAQARPEGQARVTWRKDGGAPQFAMVPIGRDVPLSIPIDHGGAHFFP